jgi:acylphosphatase
MSVARRYPVAGYVQNLHDGRVVVLAEGEGAELDRFLTDLQATMRNHIAETRSETVAATGEFRDFQVRFEN